MIRVSGASAPTVCCKAAAGQSLLISLKLHYMKYALFFIVVLCSHAVLPASPAAQSDATAVVAEVIDGATLGLKSPVMGSRRLRLAGIEAPHVAEGGEAWPLGEEARRALAALALDHPVLLRFEGLALDRYRRLVAHVFRLREPGQDRSPQPKIWLQGALLARGMARVRSVADNRAHIAEMLKVEGDARADRRGIWAHRFYRVRSAAEAGADIGSFQIVEGIVVDRARVRRRIYLNFGADWRTDFTVSIDTRLLPVFAESGLDPMDLKGRWIRVRGWIEARNGPLIEATHPEQIEVLPEAISAGGSRS